MRTTRVIGFFLALLLGTAAGLYYAWAINPVEYIDTAPASMLIDYKADYVLMVAEAYQLENDLDKAARRIALLGGAGPAELVDAALIFAERSGYTDADLAKIRRLEDDLAARSPLLETPAP